MENPIVKIDSLSHKYSIQWAVKDISLEIPQKGIYGLLGSNGAGKSTLMNIMCGVLRPTKGEISINGISMVNQPTLAKKTIGFLPQKPPLLMDLTVEEYLEHCAGMHGLNKKEIPDALERAIEQCNIKHFRKRLIRNLSGGYQQRVGIAQAIIHRPRLVVLDEPTNGLDPNQILEIRYLIKNIAEESTVILSTHILSEVQATCDYIVMIDQGGMIFSGSVNEFDNYITPNTIFVSLLESPTQEDLSTVMGVDKVECLGGTQYRVYAADCPDAIQNIVQESTTRNWRLNEIRLEHCSLDKIFSEIIKNKKN